jgi:pyrroloquinoline quinone (PQQ) biosynthesis protein C
MSFFIQLLEMTDASRRDLEALPKVHSLIHHGLSLKEYQAFLHDIYHIVLHFCPIMHAASARCADFPGVRAELEERIEEERGHEAWVLEDIDALGGDVSGAKSNLPSSPVQAMIAFNYDGAERGHPCSVLGMLYTLEVVSSVYGGRVADSIARAIDRRVEDGGFKFLVSHTSMDAEHMAKLNLLVRTIADSQAQSAIVNATRVNFFQFGRMFDEGGFSAHLMPQL